MVPGSSAAKRRLPLAPEGRSDVPYMTSRGLQLVGDSRQLLLGLPSESVDLVVTSPPFALLREKAYGNRDQAEYVSWLSEFGRAAHRVLKDSGSFVLDIGGAYIRGRPVRSLIPFRVLLDFCDSLGYRLAQEFYWFNPAKLPSPIEWVNKRKIRAKDSVNSVWWFSKSDAPKADVRRVLSPYSDRMKKLLSDPDAFYRPKLRPSGHSISRGFGTDKGGAIPANLLTFANTDSNSQYLRMCKLLGRDAHPARFPAALPSFFIRFLTDVGDTVVDLFSGSNTTGLVAESLDRKWISMEERLDYAALSAIRFMPPESSVSDVRSEVEAMERGERRVLKAAIDRCAGGVSGSLGLDA